MGNVVVVNYFLPKYATFFNYAVHNSRLYLLGRASGVVERRPLEKAPDHFAAVDRSGLIFARVGDELLAAPIEIAD